MRPKGQSIPHACIEAKPTSQSVLFRGIFINLSILSLYTHISTSHLSMIFSGNRHPSMKTAQLIAKGLGMDLGSLVNGLDQIQKQAGPHLTGYRARRRARKKAEKSEIVLDKVSQTV